MSRYFLIAIAASLIVLVALLLSLSSLSTDSPERRLFVPGAFAAPVALANRNEAIPKILSRQGR